MNSFSLASRLPYRLTSVFLLAGSLLGLGGCSIVPRVAYDGCNEWQGGIVGIPKAMELFKGKFTATSSEACATGRSIGYSALLGRNPETGLLHPSSLIMWDKKYQDLNNQINLLPYEETGDLLRVKSFADYFIKEGSQKYGKSIVTSEMAKAMFEKKILDPTQFALDGKYVPYKPTVMKICEGTGMFRTCKAPEAIAPAAAEPQ